MFDYTVTTNKDFEQAALDLKEALSRNKFGVLWELDVPGKLKEKGVEFQGKFRIFEVCNPQRAKEVLEANLMVGYFLPCKIVLFVDQGTTKLGLVRPSALVEMLDEQELKEFAQEVETELISVLDQTH